MEEVREKVRTLGSCIDSEEEVIGRCFDSKIPITNYCDTRYRIVALPEPGRQYLKVVPLGSKEHPKTDAPESVGILLWQHLEDTDAK